MKNGLPEGSTDIDAIMAEEEERDRILSLERKHELKVLAQHRKLELQTIDNEQASLASKFLRNKKELNIVRKHI